MIRAALVLCAFIFGSVNVYGYQEIGQIDTDKHVFFLQKSFFYSEMTEFGYQVEFPQATQQVSIMAIESLKVDQNKTKYETMNCDKLETESTWYQVVSPCTVVFDAMYGSVIKCNGKFQLVGDKNMEYQFAFAVCEAQRLHITYYDLTANPMKHPSSSATSAGFSFITLLMLFIFVL